MTHTYDDSPLMLPKQKEMDKVVEDIYETVSRQDAHRISQNPDAKGTLIVLCGDHGMNEVNNALCYPTHHILTIYIHRMATMVALLLVKLQQ